MHRALDKETGLVWERKPKKEAVPWPNARLMCAQKAIGGRGGWRLPIFNEFSESSRSWGTRSYSPSAASRSSIRGCSAGGVLVWTVFADQPGFALIVDFEFVSGSDAPIGVNDANTGGGPKHVWAVRGGSPSPDSY